MDIIKEARELGKLIQKDSSFLKLQEATARNESDNVLQKSISEFNALRVALNQEISRPERDQSKIDEMNTKFHELYEEIMQSEAMLAYNEAKQDATKMMDYIYQIITGSFNGFDPDAIEYQESGCSGSCDSCGGCGGN